MIKLPKPDPIDHGNPALCMGRRNKGATMWVAGYGAILALLAVGNTAPAAGDRRGPDVLQPVESRVTLVRLQMRALVFDPDISRILILKGVAGAAVDDGRDYEADWMKLAQIKSLEGLRPAEDLFPLRAAEIVAAFPLEAQVQEFQDKLHLASHAAVLAEQSPGATDDAPLPAFRFVGVRVERRQVDAQNRFVVDWAPLDLDQSYRRLVILAGKRPARISVEDAKLKPVAFPGLVMPKLPTFGDQRSPPTDEYPALEAELKALNAAGTRNDRPDAAKPVGEPKAPAVCLVRLFDVEVDPGKTYEYRIRIRMANPNYGRRDIAEGVDAKEKELLAKDWYVVPQKLAVPLDLHYYAVDQELLDLPGLAATGDARSPHSPAQPLQVDQTVLQIQKWVDYARYKKKGDLGVGDWVIAERVVATRGEPIGAQRVEVPYWRIKADRFTMASDLRRPDTGNAQSVIPSIKMQFAADGEEPILVDFRGGEVSYVRTNTKAEGAPVDPRRGVRDNTPVEVILYTADGKLLALSSAVDAVDPERVKRLANARERIRAVKDINRNKGTDKQKRLDK